MATSKALIKYNETRQQIDTLPEVKESRDKIEAVQGYLKATGAALEEQQFCAAAKLWAERRGGELLSDILQHQGGRPGKKLSTRATVSSLGLNRTQSSYWQKFTEVEDSVFESYIEQEIKAGKPLTSKTMLRFVKDCLQKDNENSSENKKTPKSKVTEKQDVVSCQATISEDLSKISELIESIKAKLAEGFTPEQVAERFSLPHIIAHAIAFDGKPDNVDDPEESEPEDLPDVQPGDWWQLGDHRLYCGDTASEEFTSQIPPASFAFADPPYNANAVPAATG